MVVNPVMNTLRGERGHNLKTLNENERLRERRKSQAHEWLMKATLPVTAWGRLMLRLQTTETVWRVFRFPDGSTVTLEETGDGRQDWTAES